MNIIKRSGEEKTFDRSKIANAIRKANETVEAADKLTEARIEKIAELCTRASSAKVSVIKEISQIIRGASFIEIKHSYASVFVTVATERCT